MDGQIKTEENQDKKRIVILVVACFCLILSIVYFTQYSKPASHYFGIDLEVTNIGVNATHYRVTILFQNITQSYWFNKWGFQGVITPFQERQLMTGDKLTIVQGYERNQTLFQNEINEGKLYCTLYFRDSDFNEYSLVLQVKKGFRMTY